MWSVIVTFIIFVIVSFVMKEMFKEKDNLIKFQSKFFIYYFLSSCFAFVCIPFFMLNPKNVKNSLSPYYTVLQPSDNLIDGTTILAFSMIYASVILRHVTHLLGLRWELRNGHVLAEDRGAVIVANHQSTIDVLGMFNIWHVMDKCASIARKELLYVFPFGIAAYLGGVVFIDRNNPKDSYRHLEVMSQVMVKNKTKLWLFPEGTRNREMTGLLPFKRGAFKVAISSQVPILPVVYSPYYFINRKDYFFGKGHVIIHCLPPFPTKGLTVADADDLSNRVHAAMQSVFQELKKEVTGSLPVDYPVGRS